jgi:signal transduction histidine kinase
MNLIKNAVDIMPDNGKITVESKEVKGGLEISFVDTGIGISDEVRPKLFSPLFTTKAHGMGFGLAIYKPSSKDTEARYLINPLKVKEQLSR